MLSAVALLSRTIQTSTTAWSPGSRPPTVKVPWISSPVEEPPVSTQADV